jgi:ornithine decarboxylase
VKPFYAVKCNPDPHILQHLYDAGVGFDCASKRELMSIQELSRNPVELVDRIVYANPCKSVRDIEYATEMGSPVTVVDSVEEVEKLEGYSGGALIRLAVDDSGSKMPFSTKFGTSVENCIAIGEAAAATRLDIRGISFHVGSGCAMGRSYADAIRVASKCLSLIRCGDTIDIGGGYLPDTFDFQEKAVAIREAIDKVQRDSDVKFIAEPGRFFAASGFDFFVQVIGKKAGLRGWSYTIDDSIYGQFSSILFDHAEPTWVRVQEEGDFKRPQGPGVIFGRTCDSVDVIARAPSMEELFVGDWLWFPNMGAYTRATASEFNGFPRPRVFADDEASAVITHSFQTLLPKGVQYMPAVSARDFWHREKLM